MPEPGRSTEETVEELVELEAELTGADGGVSGTYERGTVADVSKVPAGEVPEEYPVPVGTTHALHVEVDVDGGTVPVFVEWPDDGETGTSLDRLLGALGRSPEEFADVYGDRVALAAEGGYHRIDVERTATLHGAAAAREDASLDRTKRVLQAAVAAGTLSFLLVGTGLEALVGPLVLASWVGIPAATYYDVGAVRDHLDWDIDVRKWVVAGAVPMLNVPVGYAYLLDRRVQLRGVEGHEASDVWHRALVAGVVLPVAAVVLTLVSAGLGTLLLLTSFVLVPVAIYFDAASVEAATDWDPGEVEWALTAAVTIPLAVWWAVGLAYLLVRRRQVGRP